MIWEKFGREKRIILTFKNLCATWRIRQNEVGSHNKKEIVSAKEAANIHEVFSREQKYSSMFLLKRTGYRG